MQHTTLFAGTLTLAYTDSGKGSSTFLLLHGGAGPRSLQGLSAALTAQNYRTIVPVHPGFDGEPRPAQLTTIGELATAYLALLDELDVQDVVVAGNSMGGWLAAELASRNPSRIRGYVVMNGVGLDMDGTDLTIQNPGTMPPEQRNAAVWHNPAKFAVAPQGPALAVLLSNQRAMAVYAGTGAHFCVDPTLRGRLEGGAIRTPVLVLWGESDKIVTAEYGRRMAETMGEHATFKLVEEAGHFPQIEQLENTVRLIVEFARQTPAIAMRTQ